MPGTADSQELETWRSYDREFQGEYSDTVDSSLRMPRIPGRRSHGSGMEETLVSTFRDADFRGADDFQEPDR
jgi:hypothetical protein